MIMRKLLLFAPLLLSISGLNAQNDYAPVKSRFSNSDNKSPETNKFSIALNFGVGLPLGDYGNSSQVPFPANDTTHANGLALTGFHFNGTASYLFSPFFGGMIMVGGTSNSFNEAQWQTLRSQNIPGITTSVNGNFYIGQYLVGPYASIPVNRRIKVEFKALLGFVSANYPQLTQTFPTYYYGATVVEIKTIKPSNDFAYNFGVGLKCLLTKNLGLDFNIGYTGSDISYHEVDISYYEAGYYPYTDYSIFNRYMQLGLLEMTAGVSYNW